MSIITDVRFNDTTAAMELSTVNSSSGNITWKALTGPGDESPDGDYMLATTSTDGTTLNLGGILTVTGVTNPETSAAAFSGSVAIHGSSGPTWSSGSGVPTITQPLGSIYSRVDGTIGTTLYVSQGQGTWNAVPGV